MPAGGVADHADGLIIHNAEELEPLLVQGAHLPWRDDQIAARLPLLKLSLLHARLAQVLQGEAGYRVVSRAAPAQGALAVATPPPVLFKAGSAKAMAALEDHRLLEDLTTDGAGQVNVRE